MTSIPTPLPVDVPSFEVVVVEADPRLRTRLTVQLSEHVRPASLPSLEMADVRLADRAGVLVLGPSHADVSGLASVGRVLRARPALAAVLVTTSLSTEVLHSAMRAGVMDVVTIDATDDLIDALSRAAEAHDQHLARSGSPTGSGAPKQHGRITTVFSTKGGVGTSMVASNLAVALAQHSPRPVALVDGDLQFGDIAVMLQLSPTHTVAEAARQSDRLDEELLRSLVCVHAGSGLLVLPAPTDPASADAVSAAAFVRILDALASFCSHVVVDTPTSFDDVVVATLESSDDIVYVTGLDIPSVKNVKLGLQTLRRLNVGAGKVRLAVNRANSKVRLDVAEVERTLQLKAECLLPSDVAVPRSMNKGVAVVLDAPRAGVSRSLERFAAQFRHPAEASTD